MKEKIRSAKSLVKFIIDERKEEKSEKEILQSILETEYGSYLILELIVQKFSPRYISGLASQVPVKTEEKTLILENMLSTMKTQEERIREEKKSEIWTPNSKGLIK